MDQQKREIMPMTVEPIPRVQVNSSALKAYGYDPERQLLDVEFPPPAGCSEGPIWRYDSVKPEDFAELDLAESKGSHWHKMRKNLSGQQIGGPLPKKRRGTV